MMSLWHFESRRLSFRLTEEVLRWWSLLESRLLSRDWRRRILVCTDWQERCLVSFLGFTNWGCGRCLFLSTECWVSRTESCPTITELNKYLTETRPLISFHHYETYTDTMFVKSTVLTFKEYPSRSGPMYSPCLESWVILSRLNLPFRTTDLQSSIFLICLSVVF